MNDWHRSVKYLYDNTNIKIYISGSSSLILKSETSKLTGRFILHEVLGLNFQEFLEFKNLKSYTQFTTHRLVHNLNANTTFQQPRMLPVPIFTSFYLEFYYIIWGTCQKVTC